MYIQTLTTATTPIDSWEGTDIWVTESYWDDYLASEGSISHRTVVEQGIEQGFIVLIDPYIEH